MVNPFKYDYGRFMVIGLPDKYDTGAIAYYALCKHSLSYAWDDAYCEYGPFEQMELVEILDETTPLTRKLRNAIRWYEERVASR